MASGLDGRKRLTLSRNDKFVLLLVGAGVVATVGLLSQIFLLLFPALTLALAALIFRFKIWPPDDAERDGQRGGDANNAENEEKP